MRSGYDAIQADGQRIEFGEQRGFCCSVPTGCASRSCAATATGNGPVRRQRDHRLQADDNVYARVEKPGTVDSALVYLVRDLQLTMPMARMFHTGFPQEMEKLLMSISYVEEDALFDVPTDHLAPFRRGDMQVWIAQGEQPLPRRVHSHLQECAGPAPVPGDLSSGTLAKVATNSLPSPRRRARSRSHSSLPFARRVPSP